METSRYEQGMEILGNMVSKEVLQETVERMAKFSPDIARLIVEIPFGSIYTRPGLEPKQRSLLTISSLVTQGADAQLDFHIHAALNVGLTPHEVVEAVIHCISYAGFPKCISALFVVMKVFEQRGIEYSA
jgi:4-carboxymuconolactone decarboxylase